MADTVYLKRGVEQYVRGTLCEEYGVKFSSKILTLVTGGTHEFDAVSEDGTVVAAIKAAGGRLPEAGSHREVSRARRPKCITFPWSLPLYAC